MTILFLAVPLVHFGKGLLFTDQGNGSGAQADKTAQITEPAQQGPREKTLIGNWILFLHYPSETRSVDISIDVHGLAVSGDRTIADDLTISIDNTGSVNIDNQKAHMVGVMNADGNHIDGMAVIEGTKAPLPFSLFKIDESPGSK